MALKDLFASFGDTLEELFNAKPYEAGKGRARLIKGIEAAREQSASGRTRVPNRWWTISNGIVAFSPQLRGTPLIINGKGTNFIPADRFGEFLDAFKAEVEAGEFDAMIEAIETGTGNAGSSVPVSAGGRSRGPMSEEAKANIRAGRARAMAAREASGQA
ncbi:hypothetical protein [Sphingomonas bacterium]|uniref:hypothetical protein n=1 Tax=Sphingomonas bacterium TaxID=1895847 RepID=UPI0020C5FBB4|nr:hypothetical protein [Sphingomonas bacterium]